MSVEEPKWTAQELANKIDWEGGTVKAIAGYGLSSSLLPDDCPEAVVTAWKGLETFVQAWADTIDDWLPEPGVEDE